MANTLTPSFPELWADSMQETFYQNNVAMKIADISFKAKMKYGDTLNRPYRSALTAQIYTPGTAINIDNLTDNADYLTIDKKFATGFYVDEFESIQSMYDTAALYGKDAGELLSNMIDSEVLGEVLNAASYVDAWDVGGTAWEGIVLSTSNLVPMLAAVKQKLKKLNVTSNNLFGVISPEVENLITQYVEGRDTAMGDRIGENGFIGMYYGIKFYVSNQLTSTAVLALATAPSDTNLVTIGGVAFHFVTSLGTTAGNVLIDTTADNARAHMAALINAPATTTSYGYKFADNGAAQRLLLNKFSAVNDDSANTLTVTAKGVGVLDVSEALTDGTDTWTAATQLQHNLFGVVGNPVLVVQRAPSIAVRPVQDKLGSNYLNGVLFGRKTFVDNGKQMVDVKVRCDNRNA